MEKNREKKKMYRSPYALVVSNASDKYQNAVFFGRDKYLLSVNFGSDDSLILRPSQNNVSYSQLLLQSESKPFTKQQKNNKLWI